MNFTVRSETYEEIEEKIARLESDPTSITTFSYYTGTKLPESLFLFDSIEDISIEGKNITELPSTLASSPRLRELHVGKTQVRTLPDGVYESHTIESLTVTNSKLTHLPDMVGEMPSLRSLVVFHNDLVKLPDLSRTQLYQFNALWNPIEHTDLTKFPDTLKYLFLSGEVSPNIDLRHMKLLEMLRIIDDRNAIESIRLPPSIKTLSIRSPKSPSFPDGISDLPNLFELTWMGGNFGEIELDVESLPNLSNLILSGCGLTSIPKWLGKIKILNVLSLSVNKITRLPNALGSLKRLHKLNLCYNPITEFEEHSLDSVSSDSLIIDIDLWTRIIERFPDMKDDRFHPKILGEY